MANASDIVNVNIVVQDAVANVSNFGTILLVGRGPHLAGTIQSYDVNPTGLAAMVTDGYLQGDAVYLATSRIAAQNPTVTSVKAYARSTINAQSVECTPTVTDEGYQYNFNVVNPSGVSTEIEYDVPAAATATTIATALNTLVTAINGITSTDNTGSFTITPTTSGDRFHLDGIDSALDVEDGAVDAGIAAELTAALTADPDFYGVIIDANCKAELVAAAAWCATNKKILLGLSIDSEVLDSGVTDDVVSTIVATSNHYANVFATREHSSYVNAGNVGRQFSQDPGSSSWANQTVTGATVDTFSATEHSVIVSKGGLSYESYAGLSLTRNGQASSGRFFDITRGTDWLSSIIQQALLSYLANQEKVSYTDVGIGELEGVVRGQLGVAEAEGFLATGWDVQVPKAADVPAADKATRTLNSLTFSATLAGAIHTVDVEGTITL